MIEKLNLFQKWIETIVTASLGVIGGIFTNWIAVEKEQLWVLVTDLTQRNAKSANLEA